jgi:RNA polymerase sigma factor (sigma-70 family)
MLKQELLQAEPSNEILAGRIAQRDVDALEIIYERFASRVFTLAVMLSDCAEAEQIVLQVFCRLWLEVDQYLSHDGTFQEWFLNLVRAQILDRLVRDGRRKAKERIAAINRWLSDVTKQKSGARERMHQPRSRIRVWRKLQELTLEQRCVIVLASYGGYKQKEISQLLDMPLSAVEQHARLGLKGLRDTPKQETAFAKV